ncbi:MAG: prolyl oligopeptidase family serine peptidase [Lentisphaeria bacterium]|nr:prolyl oligopeptidase family serine peptidase [Lentisphaeria bacterium]
MHEILIESSLDGTAQPSLYFHPQTDESVPLVVGLHTWSYDRFNQRENYLPLCREAGYALLLPEFRGPNLIENPLKAQACGSDLARQDVIDAVRHVCVHSAIDPERIFLLGCSGGGHMALLAAETAPELFRAVEVWCPVSDLIEWHRSATEKRQSYARHIEACLGGTPSERTEEYIRRSPARHPERLKDLPVSIHHGRHDRVVPFRHSVVLAEQLEKAGNERVYLDIFDGGHEQNPAHSFEWFAKLAGTRRSSVRITG